MSEEVRIAHWVPMTREAWEDGASAAKEFGFMLETGRSRWTQSDAITVWRPWRGWWRKARRRLREENAPKDDTVGGVVP